MSNGLAVWARIVTYKWRERIRSGEGKCCSSLSHDLQDWKRPPRAAQAWRNQQERIYDLLHPTEPGLPEHRGFGDQQLALSPPQHSITWNLLESENSRNLAFKISAHLCRQPTPHTIHSTHNHLFLILYYLIPTLVYVSWQFCLCLVDCLVRFRDQCSCFSGGSLQGSLCASATSHVRPHFLPYTFFFFLSLAPALFTS